MRLREEIASLICIHENGIGTRELVDAQEGTDHQGEWQSALNTADHILDYLAGESMAGILVLPNEAVSRVRDASSTENAAGG